MYIYPYNDVTILHKSPTNALYIYIYVNITLFTLLNVSTLKGSSSGIFISEHVFVDAAHEMNPYSLGIAL